MLHFGILLEFNSAGISALCYEASGVQWFLSGDNNHFVHLHTSTRLTQNRTWHSVMRSECCSGVVRVRAGCRRRGRHARYAARLRTRNYSTA